MVDLRKLIPADLEQGGWQNLVASIETIGQARTDPRFFKQVDRFVRFFKELASIAIELNSNHEAAEQAYQHVRESKILARNKTVNRFENIQQQTYEICMESLQRDFENMFKAFEARNLEALEHQYRQVKSWPIRYNIPA